MAKKKQRKDHALEHAIKAAGGPFALAKFITDNYESITPQAVCGWRRCPALRVIQVEQATSGVVPRHRLRPDLYPEDKKAA